MDKRKGSSARSEQVEKWEREQRFFLDENRDVYSYIIATVTGTKGAAGAWTFATSVSPSIMGCTAEQGGDLIRAVSEAASWALHEVGKMKAERGL